MAETILTIVQEHAQWARLIIFLVAFAESLVVIGLIVPGWLLLVGIGGLVGSGVLPFYPVVLSAFCGAVIGEMLSYYFGRFFEQDILALKIVQKHQDMVEKGRYLFAEYGTLGVFAGRFFGPTRAFVPFLAGVSEMPQRRFFWVNTLSALVWAPVYLLPGMLVGASFEVPGDKAKELVFLLSIMAIYAWWAAHRVLKWRRAKRRLAMYQKLQLLLMSVIAVLLFYAFSLTESASLFKQIALRVWQLMAW